MATVYCSPTGNDANAGTLASPWLTINKGLTSAAVGDTLQLRAGTYAQAFKQGRDTLIIENYPGEQVIIQRTTSGTVLGLENSRNITLRNNAGGGYVTVNSTVAGDGKNNGIQVYMTGGGSPGFVPSAITIDGWHVVDIAGYGIQIKDATAVMVKNVDVSHCGTGIRFLRVVGTLAAPSNIQDSTLHHMDRMITNTVTPTTDDNGATGCAIDDGCKGVIVQRNTIYECHANSFDYGTDGGAVELFNCGGTGTGLNDPDGIIVQYNLAYNNEGFIETGTNDSVTYPMNGNIVRRNLVYGTGSIRGAAPGATPIMYIRAGTNYQIYNNTFDLDSGNAIFYVQGAFPSGYDGPITNLKIKNNIAVSRSTTYVLKIYNVGSTTGIEIDHNLFFNSTGSSVKVADDGTTLYDGTQLAAWKAAHTAWGAGDVWNSDPLWTNRTIRDYTIQSGSPAKDVGAVIGGTTDGYIGILPDMGKWEYARAAPTFWLDTFTRSVTSGLGTPEIGGAYTVLGTASLSNVNGSEATHDHAAVNLNSGGVITNTLRDIDESIRFKVDTVPVGGAAVIQFICRYVDASNYLRYSAKINPTTITGIFEKTIAGTTTAIGTADSTALTVAANQYYWVRIQSIGNVTATAKGKIWQDGTSEPAAWLTSQTYTDAALLVAGKAGYRTLMSTGSTSLPSRITVDSANATDQTPGDVTAPAAPVITFPAADGYNIDGIVNIQGTAEAGSSVELFDAGVSQGKATAINGAFTIILPSVAAGVHTYTTKATDAALNVSLVSNTRTITVDLTPPSVSSSNPAAGATGVATSVHPAVTFSEAMDPLTITTSSFTVAAGGVNVAGTIALTAGNTVATFTPTAALAIGTTYVITLANTIKDVAGNRLP